MPSYHLLEVLKSGIFNVSRVRQPPPPGDIRTFSWGPKGTRTLSPSPPHASALLGNKEIYLLLIGSPFLFIAHNQNHTMYGSLSMTSSFSALRFPNSCLLQHSMKLQYFLWINNILLYEYTVCVCLTSEHLSYFCSRLYPQYVSKHLCTFFGGWMLDHHPCPL